MDDLMNYMGYKKKLAKKTSKEEAVKSYYSSKAWSHLLNNLTYQLSFSMLGLDALQVDNLS